jgi:hypothetical protein
MPHRGQGLVQMGAELRKLPDVFAGSTMNSIRSPCGGVYPLKWRRISIEPRHRKRHPASAPRIWITKSQGRAEVEITTRGPAHRLLS